MMEKSPPSKKPRIDVLQPRPTLSPAKELDSTPKRGSMVEGLEERNAISNSKIEDDFNWARACLAAEQHMHNARMKLASQAVPPAPKSPVAHSSATAVDAAASLPRPAPTNPVPADDATSLAFKRVKLSEESKAALMACPLQKGFNLERRIVFQPDLVFPGVYSLQKKFVLDPNKAEACKDALVALWLPLPVELQWLTNCVFELVCSALETVVSQPYWLKDLCSEGIITGRPARLNHGFIENVVTLGTLTLLFGFDFKMKQASKFWEVLKGFKKDYPVRVKLAKELVEFLCEYIIPCTSASLLQSAVSSKRKNLKSSNFCEGGPSYSYAFLKKKHKKLGGKFSQAKHGNLLRGGCFDHSRIYALFLEDHKLFALGNRDWEESLLTSQEKENKFYAPPYYYVPALV